MRKPYFGRNLTFQSIVGNMKISSMSPKSYQLQTNFKIYEGGSICNENPSITPSTNALGFNAICQMKDQSVAVIMVHDTLFYLTKFSMLQTF